MERERAAKLLLSFLLCLCLSACMPLVVKPNEGDGGGSSDQDTGKLLGVMAFAAWMLYEEFWKGEVVEPPTLPEPSVVTEEPK